MSSQIKDYNYKTFKGLISVDFDHTLCDSKYPLTGDPIDGAIKYMKKLERKGYGIVINTCRDGIALEKSIVWLNVHGIPYHYVNCNFPEMIRFFNSDCRKISADVYVDDKNLGGLPEWKTIYKIIKKMFKNGRK